LTVFVALARGKRSKIVPAQDTCAAGRQTIFLTAPLPLVAVLWGLSLPSATQPRSKLLEACPRVPASLRPVLDHACLDCHSNETRWPWYNRLPVVSRMVRQDVEKGREHLNFSAWNGAPPHQPTANEIQELCDAVSEGVMPPRAYRMMHSEARLTNVDKDAFCAWADQLRAGSR
jgi:Haem-binding domain